MAAELAAFLSVRYGDCQLLLTWLDNVFPINP
jgi:hypothetical protein